jgi:hypothetical protein
MQACARDVCRSVAGLTGDSDRANIPVGQRSR